MDPSDAIQLLILLVLLYSSNFFSSSETALTTANKIRMKNLADDGDTRAQMFLKVTEDPGRMLSAILIGNNIANIFASSIVTTLAISLFGSKLVGVATGVLTLVILIFCEITPKSSATLNAEKLALKYAKPIFYIMKILTPVVFIINKLAYLVMRLTGVDPNAKPEVITENELRSILDVSHEEGVIESEERQMINNVVDFGDSLAKDVMVPKVDVCFADIDSTYEELIEIFREEHFTRLPVYEGSTDNVVGIINMKDLLLYDHKQPFSIKNYLREPYYTYEFKKTSELMREMRQSVVNIVIVLDEYGVTAGLITLEDLLEEIVGDIKDEYDADEDDSIRQISDLEYIVEASMKLDDINDKLNLNLESEVYDSIGGLVIGLLDHLPCAGESVTIKSSIPIPEAYTGNGIPIGSNALEADITLIVESAGKNRIDEVRIQISLPEANDEEDNEE